MEQGGSECRERGRETRQIREINERQTDRYIGKRRVIEEPRDRERW